VHQVSVAIGDTYYLWRPRALPGQLFFKLTTICTLRATVATAMNRASTVLPVRVDDVLNVSGHRIGTAEVENAINMHTGVLESAVVGYPHDLKGQGIYAYVIMDKMPGDKELICR
jgi:acyl-CoA synthetase (AMP-forming)/AMP-acid ligase II